jgi:phosphoglycolate phosphatase
MKERFDGLIEHLLAGNIFLQEAIEILERSMIVRALEHNSGNQCAASKQLGIHRNTLQRKMTEYQIGNGNGAPILIRRAMGEQATEAEVQEALEFFLEYYGQHDLEHTVLYAGVREAVDRLRDAGKRLAVLTNKPVRMSRDIVEGLGLGAHFFQVYGGNSFEFKKPNPIGIQALMAESGIPRESTLMVGDSSVDVRTARNARIRCCGVSYGFQPESLADPAPDLLVDRMEDMADWVLKEH